MRTMKNTEKIYSIQLIRAVCAIGIVIFHFGCHSNCDMVKNLFAFDGLLGSIIVPVFFMISGYVLYYNYKEINSLKIYYYKRWKAIFPMFFLVYIFVYIYNVILAGKIFYGPNAWRLIFSLFGLDGYLTFIYGIPSYYILGEWFLGALVFVYVVYPLLALLLRKFKFSWVVILLILILARWGFVIIDNLGYNPNFNGWTNSHLVSCLLEFYIGILFCKFMKYLKRNSVVVLSFVMTLVLVIVFPVFYDIFDWSILFAMSIFVWLFRLGEFVMLNNHFRKFFNEIGVLSLPIFYLQHLVILFVFSHINPVSVSKSLFLMIFVVVLIILLSKALQVVCKGVTSSKAYSYFEKCLV